MQEAIAIYEYTKRYGEPPPLNLNLRRKYIAIWGIGEYGKSRIGEELDSKSEQANRSSRNFLKLC
jgi:hypothetical protein